MMKRLLAIAAFLLASSTAQAQYTFEYGGHTIRIDPDRGTVSIPGVYDNSGTVRRPKRSHNNQDTGRSTQTPPEAKSDQTKREPQNKSDPQTTPSSAPASTAAAPAEPSAPANSATTLPEPSTTANNAPADSAIASPPPLPAPEQPSLREPEPAPQPPPL